MARPTANLRLFVALYPPADISRALLQALESLPLPPARKTSLSNIHLTLQFVGDVPARALEPTKESVIRSAAGLTAFRLTPRRLVSLPLRAHPRLIAAETDSPAPLLELQRRLAHRLASNSREKPGDRFLPHFTLCRFVPGPRPQEIDHPIDLTPFEVTEIVLMRSTLHPSGAEHHPLLQVRLESPP